jgi:hypothetical protein
MALTFIFYGLLAVAVFALLGYSRLFWPFKLVILVLIVSGAGVFSFIFLIEHAITLDKVPAWYARSPYRELILFVAMLFGMVARYFNLAIEGRRTRMSELRAKGDQSRVRLQFDIWEFLNPLFVSVITFGALLNQLGSEGVSLANFILSFQTGFFWQTILSRAEQDKA